MRTLFIVCLLALGWGCQANSGTPESQTLTAGSSGGIVVSEESAQMQDQLQVQRDRFLQDPGFIERLQRLLELEQQALQLAVDEPLKLGSIGSAILDTYPGSQTGHYVMSLFYAHVESTDAKATHDQELARLQDWMSANADGTAAAPYPVLTIYDAHTVAKSAGNVPVGSIYQIPRNDVFGLLMVARPQHGQLQRTHFDISPVLEAFENAQAMEAAASDSEADESDREAILPSQPTLMQLLAARMDSAAQTAIGRYLGQVQKYEDAVSWLRVASRSGNVLANTLLARIYLTQAEAAEDEEQKTELRELSLENHLHAIAMGSTDSMYTLANLYINDYYGEENRAAAIPLFIKAGDLGHAQSLLYLGYLHNAGKDVPQNVDKATEYFYRAAALDNPQAILSYGRFLSGLATAGEPPEMTQENGAQVHTWLEELAAEDDAEAMVVLGNLHARGVGTPTSTRRAVRWYKKAVKQATNDADIVNEVAWTLVASDISSLKRPSYAKRLMDGLMNNNAEARNRPEYLDTWAAAHAAKGDFEQAIALQKEAIEQATAQEREDVLEILNGHLELFEAGATITEQAP